MKIVVCQVAPTGKSTRGSVFLKPCKARESIFNVTPVWPANCSFCSGVVTDSRRLFAEFLPHFSGQCCWQLVDCDMVMYCWGYTSLLQ